VKAVIYLRVSTKEQAEEGYSIPAQAEACRRFIADQGWELADEYVDRGESARSADRPQLRPCWLASRMTQPSTASLSTSSIGWPATSRTTPPSEPPFARRTFSFTR
jgi:hypothetical protein